MMPLTQNPLLTDLYQLTMLQAYLEHDMAERAVFEFFVRRLPGSRGFLVAAGLEQVLTFLEQLRFEEEELEWVRSSGRFSNELVNALSTLRFTGDVDAMPEGTIFFANEPILRVTAPLPQAQLIETRLINILHFQTLIASKAARATLAAPGKSLIDFGLRRAHGAEAGLYAARAAYIAGFTGTSNVLASVQFGIPAFDTMGHSFIQAHDTEEEAFERFATVHRKNVTLLIDTYNVQAAARKIVALAPRLKADGITILAVRIDSGDLAEQSKIVRRLFDAAGLRDIGIFVSGNLDEIMLRELHAQRAPINGFGLGAHLDTSSDAPFLDCAYKIQEYNGRPRRKRSVGKETWPGRKQVYRQYARGLMAGDMLTNEDDVQDGEALIRPIMRNGRRMALPEKLDAMRERCAHELSTLPPRMRTLYNLAQYPVTVSPVLQELAKRMDEETSGAKQEEKTEKADSVY